MAIHAASDKSKQLSAILSALHWGPCSTATLHQVSGSMAVSTRISELRSRGYLIARECKERIHFYSLLGRVAE